MKKNNPAPTKSSYDEPTFSDRLICIILAIYEPNMDFLHQQLSSISNQTHRRTKLFLVNSDLIPKPAVIQLCNEFDFDFVLLTPEQKLGATQAFEYGLRYVVDHKAELPEFVIALCDQDDIWKPKKLETQLKFLKEKEVSLVHSDATLIDENGTKIGDSVFARERRAKRSSIRSLLYMNNITGMTALFELEVANSALPFPRQNGPFFYHDLWLGLVASMQKGVYFIDQPLVEYRQHEGNVVGAVGGKAKRKNVKTISKLKRNLNTYYMASYLAKSLYVRSVEFESVGHKADQKELRKLKPYLSHYNVNLRFLTDSIYYLLRGNRPLARAALSQFIGRNVRFGLALSRLMGGGLSGQLQDLDRQRFLQAPGVLPPDIVAEGNVTHSAQLEAISWQNYVDSRKIAKWTTNIDQQRPMTFNVLVPSLNPQEMFAGIATAIDMGIILAELGENVRFIATDAPISYLNASEYFIKNRLSEKEVFARIEIECGVSSKSIDFNKGDLFIATAWWTAHIANTIIEEFSHKKFIYLIQDYEPNFYPWGDEYSNAMETYRFNYLPVYNTTLLRDYFEKSRLLEAKPNAICFRPSINVEKYSSLPRPQKSSKAQRFLLYGRPEVARNMFGSAVEAICGFIKDNNIHADDVEFHSIGLMHEPIMMPNGIILKSVGKIEWGKYPSFLTGYNFGLALMLSPHPSHLPIEMAAAGIRVVTNGFANKDLSILSPLILSAQPNVHSIQSTIETVYKQLDNCIIDSERMIDLASLGVSLEEAVESLHKRLLSKSNPLDRR